MGVELSKAIREFASHSQARGLGKSTVKNRIQPLNRGLELWGDLQVQNLHARHIDALFSRWDWSPATRNIYLGNLRLFFQWCRAMRYMPLDADPTLGWRNITVPQGFKLWVPVDRFGELLDAATHPQIRAVIAVGLYTFLRGSEISTLHIEDIEGLHSDTPVLHVYRHKTREADTLPVCEELREELDRWLVWYASQAGVPQKHWYLIPRRVMNPFTGLTMLQPENRYTHPYLAVQKTLELLGYDTEGSGVHTLRRSGARAWFDEMRGSGYDGALLRVSSMLGHKSTTVTQVYLGLNLEREQRNAQLSGKRMFASTKPVGTLVDASERFGTEG
jgi:integrase